ncbi:hypothetical protein [Methylobacterium planeticum]|uniref:hypothetical protein n=1 Tax=Methylobacterium planeticum TaxID=2615211 RepID=UPI00178455DC|nr:hypothetical protein [Methylobacterium planeticum]
MLLPGIRDGDLAEPAQLTLWPEGLDGPKSVEPTEVASLREALGTASAVLRAGTASPWIITASGMILSPSWLMGALPQARAAPPPPPPPPCRAGSARRTRGPSQSRSPS